MPLSSGVNVFSIPVWILLLDIYQRFRMGIRACKSCQSSVCFHVPYSAFSFSRTVRFRFQEEDRTDRLKNENPSKVISRTCIVYIHSICLSARRLPVSKFSWAEIISGDDFVAILWNFSVKYLHLQ